MPCLQPGKDEKWERDPPSRMRFLLEFLSGEEDVTFESLKISLALSEIYEGLDLS
jgi:hypothetical protein